MRDRKRVKSLSLDHSDVSDKGPIHETCASGSQRVDSSVRIFAVSGKSRLEDIQIYSLFEYEAWKELGYVAWH